MRNILKQLNQLQTIRKTITPSLAWKVQARANLMSQIRNTVTEEKNSKIFAFDRLSKAMHIFISSRTLAISRAALLVVLVLGAAFAGWNVSVRASSDSLPGDTLWTVKLALEKTELAVTNSKKKKAELHVKFAGRRAEEIKEVIKRKPADEIKAPVTTALESLKNSMESAKTGLTEIKDTSRKESVEVAELIDQKSKEILDDLHETLDTVKQDQNEVTELVQNVGDTVYAVEDTEVKSLGILVEKQLEEPNEEVVTDLKNRVEEKLEKTVVQFVELENRVSKVVSSTSLLTTESDTAIASSTQKILDSATNTNKKLEESKKLVDETYEKALLLLESDAVLEAVDVLQQLKQIVTDLEVQIQSTESLLKNDAMQHAEVLGDRIQDHVTSTTPIETSGTTTLNKVESSHNSTTLNHQT